MTQRAADDVDAIARRLKEIQQQERPLENDNLETATGHDLRLLANRYGVKWAEGDSDYAVRCAIRSAIEWGSA
jgi:hypothetical protein